MDSIRFRGITGWALVLLCGLGTGWLQSAEAGSCLVEGRVLDRTSGLPIAGARVSVASGLFVPSDQDGRFVLEASRSGRLLLRIRKEGYRPVRRNVRGEPDQLVQIEVLLDRLPTFQEDVLVQGQGQTTTEPAVELDVERVLELPGVGEDALQTLKYQPGVSGMDDWSARLFVRGGRPDQNGIFLDGIPIYDPYRLFGLTSLFNPETLDSIRLYPGGFDVQYGDRLSAVIEVENRVGDPGRRLAGSANVSLTNTNLTAEGGFGLDYPGSWLLALRRSYYDLLLGALDDSDSQYPAFTDAQARLMLQPRPNHRWTLTLLGCLESTDLAADVEDNFGDEEGRLTADDDQRDYVAGLRGEHRFSPRLRGTYILSWSRNQQVSDIDYYDGSTGYEFAFDQDLASDAYSLRSTLEAYPDRHDLLAGLELARSENGVTFRIRADDPSFEIPDSLQNFELEQDFTKMGAFLQDNWQITDGWELKAGLRWDRSTLSDRSVTSPRVSTRWLPSSRWELGAAWGLYYQFPSYESLQGEGFFLDLRGLKELELEPERAVHYVLTSRYQGRRGWSLGLDLYHKELSDILQSGQDLETVLILDENDQVVPYSREMANLIPENSRRGHARGAELTFTFQEGPTRPYYGMLIYAWGQAETRDEGGWRWENWDRRHQLTWIGGWHMSRSFDLSWKWRFGTGFPETPVTRVIRVVNDLDGDGQYEPDEGEDFSYQRDDPEEVWNSVRFPNYHRLDLRLQYSRDLSRFDLAVYLDLINVYARENVFQYDYDDEYRERESITGMPLLPSFGIKVSF